MEKEYAKRLMEQHLSGSLSALEKGELKGFLQMPGNRQLFLDIMEELDVSEVPVAFNEQWNNILEQTLAVDKSLPEPVPAVVQLKQRSNRLLRWGWAAACVLLVVSGLVIVNRKEQTALPEIASKADIPQAGDGAVLTLADGSTVLLDAGKKGRLADQHGAKLLLDEHGLSYDATGESAGTVAYNTIATPYGKKFQAVLPDGSKIWMNAGSSVRFPTVFNGDSRDVEINGEVYFEVAKREKQSFIVRTNGLKVQVLGTHFNVKHYNGEPAMVTLLEGAVKVDAGSNGLLLAPGKQALFTGNKLSLEEEVSLEEVMAWKNGNFIFNGADLHTIMKQVQRWYDAEVVFENEVKDTYTVSLSRDIPVSQLLNYLELSGGVKFKVENKKISVFRN